MTSNWSFDKKFIEDVIAKGYVLLDDPKLSKATKKSIRTDIQTFTRFTNGDFDSRPTFIPKPPHDLEKLKHYILRRMESQYHNLGEETILWTMDLGYEEIFKIKGRNKKTILTLDDQVETTLETYHDHSKRLLKAAKPILSNDIIRQIQEVKNLGTSSYCYYDEITGLPYLILNPKNASWITAHETEHAVEELRKLEGHRYYAELGPILIELLFNDTLYKNQGFLNVGDYKDRMLDAEEQLLTLFNYFEIMLTFASMNFNVPTDVFVKEFQEICESDTQEGLIDFLREEIAPTDLVDDMAYLYSYLKAIELREQLQTSKQDCAYVLEPHLKTKKFTFTPKKENFDIYRRFHEEMVSKTKQSK